MNRKTLTLLGACVITLAAAASAFAQMPPMPDAKTKTPSYTQTNLVTSGKRLKGKIHDKNLLNPWGLVQGPTPFWISDNNAGVSTLYDGNGKIFTVADGNKKVPFVVTVPPPNEQHRGCGAGWESFSTAPPQILAATFLYFPPRTGRFQDGKSPMAPEPCSTWITPRYPRQQPARCTKASPSPRSTDTSLSTRRISDRATSMSSIAPTIRQSLTGTFTDPNPIAGFAPFGITLFGTSNLWVSYAMQDAAKHDPVHQVGAGYIDIFTTDGVFVERFATGGNLNAPWGMVLTPSSFGPLGGDFWIGNFGDGNINAFDSTGTQVGQPTDKKGKPLNVDGLWALVFGNGSNNAATTSLYFTAGPNMESEGIFGKFDVTTKKKSAGMGGRNRTLLPMPGMM